ncbi:MAG: CBS domain-containing protein [Candidatus Aenigmarchaeota archaeon]|nr:CBS domain-containing protein [Candidatus Aenigmarchaeota archaeon]
MMVKDILVSDIQSISPDETVSKALGLFERYKIHQLPGISGKNVLGMIFLKDIVVKDINPEKVKVSKFIRHVPTLRPEMTPEEAAKVLINAGVRAALVVDGNEIMSIVSETDLLTFVDTNDPVEMFMSSPICALINDKIGKIRSLMRRHNISRVPILDENKSLVGCVDSLDLIKLLKPKEGLSKTTESVGEKIVVKDMPVKSVMRDCVTIERKTPVSVVRDELKKHEEVIVVEEKTRKGIKIKKPVGIVTPKDILEIMFVEESRRPSIQLINVFEFDELVRDDIKREVEKFISKIEKLFDIESVFIYFDRHKRGGRVKHSIRVRLKTNVGLFVAHTWDWEVMKCLQEVLNKVERSVKKKHEKLVGRKKAKRKMD